MAEFAVVLGINHENGFNWWLKHMLEKRDRIIDSIRKWQIRSLKRSHEFGIKLPENVEQPYPLDAKNVYALWRDAISKEIENV